MSARENWHASTELAVYWLLRKSTIWDWSYQYHWLYVLEKKKEYVYASVGVF
jgi:hypothetical protein